MNVTLGLVSALLSAGSLAGSGTTVEEAPKSEWQSQWENATVSVWAHVTEWGVPGPATLLGGGPIIVGGENKLSDTFFTNACCQFDAIPCDTSPGTYSPMDLVVFNSYWSDVLPPAGDPNLTNWIVDFTAAVAPPDLSDVIIIFPTTPISFGDLSGLAGLDVTFCIALIVEIPVVPGGIVGAFHGFGVESPTLPGTTVAAPVNNFSIL